MSPYSGGITAAELNAQSLVRRLEQPMTGRCALCKWMVEGTAGEVIAAQQEHRVRKHGQRRRLSRLGRVAKGTGWKQPPLTDEDKIAIEREIAKRKRLNGIGEAE